MCYIVLYASEGCGQGGQGLEQALAVLAIHVQRGAPSLDRVFTLQAAVWEGRSGTPGRDT